MPWENSIEARLLVLFDGATMLTLSGCTTLTASIGLIYGLIAEI